MKRILAHHIIYKGVDYPMSVAEIADDGTVVSITPYEKETANTVFVNGTIELKVKGRTKVGKLSMIVYTIIAQQ